MLKSPGKVPFSSFETGNISWLRNIIIVDPYPSLPLSGSIWRNSHGVGVKQGNGDITF
jgi:hypothetical protein